MCMSAVIWSNIKTVYYGNTKDDAADIGFRDSDIYDFFSDPSKGTIELEQMGRDETLKAFNEFKDKKDKVIY
jgi:guanine deaminase